MSSIPSLESSPDHAQYYTGYDPIYAFFDNRDHTRFIPSFEIDAYARLSSAVGDFVRETRERLHKPEPHDFVSIIQEQTSGFVLPFQGSIFKEKDGNLVVIERDGISLKVEGLIDATIAGTDTLLLIETKTLVRRGHSKNLSKRVEMLKNLFINLDDEIEKECNVKKNAERKKLKYQHALWKGYKNLKIIGVLGGIGWLDDTEAEAIELGLWRLVTKGDEMVLLPPCV